MTEPKQSATPRRRATRPRSATTGRFVAKTAADAPRAGASSPAPSQSLELYVLRHADAGDPAQWPGDDADRPLSKKGRRQARRLAEWLRALKLKPDAVVTSPKLRAVDTAKPIAKRLNAPLTEDQRLADAFDGSDLEGLVAGLDAGAARVVLVGHDPDFSGLVSWLVGAPVSLRKGALARVDLPNGTFAAGRASLNWLLPPDAIPD